MARTPRAYQAIIVDDVVPSHWRAGRRRVLIVAPVGGGKTAIGEWIVIDKVLKHDWAQVFWLGPTETLLDQPAAKFSDAAIAHAFVKAGRAYDPNAVVQFCSPWTFANRDVVAAKDKSGQPYRRCLLVVDEAHRCRSSTYHEVMAKLLAAFEVVYVLGLTATPYRLDSRGLSEMFDVLIEATTPRRLMDEGVILRPIYFTQPPPDGDTEEVIFRPGIVGNVVATWQQRTEGLPTICRAYSLAHSRLLVDRFRAIGIRAIHIDGTMSTAARRRLLAGLAIGGRSSTHPLAIEILCAGSNIFDEGFDSRASYEMLLPRGQDALEAWTLLRCPSVDLSSSECLELRRCVRDAVLPELRDFWPTTESGEPMEPPTYNPLCVLIDAAPTASCGAWMQRQGRVVRSWLGDGEVEVLARAWQGLGWSHGKNRAIVLCHSSNLERHGPLILHEGFELSSDEKWAPKLRLGNGITKLHVPAPATCPGCLCVDEAGTVLCRYCGVTMSQPKLPEEKLDVELVQSEAASFAVSTPGTREAFLRARYQEMRARIRAGLLPYKVNYAAVRFSKRFGHWPPHAMDQMLRREYGIS